MPSALLQAFRDQTGLILNHGENLLRAYQPQDLHQFRVYTRRTRSLLKQMQNGSAAYFLKSWGGFFKSTNRARDWDVFLESSRELLPADQSGLFEPLLQPRLEASHEPVFRFLRSPQWQRHLAGWRGFLHKLEHYRGAALQGRLSDVFERARDACALAVRTGDDFAWHKFRIAIKNLRYVADALCLDPHSDQDQLQEVIEACKILQTYLGDWHDTIVQLRLIDGPELAMELQATRELAETRARLEEALLQKRQWQLAQARIALDQLGLFA